MYKLSKTSKMHYDTLHPNLKAIIDEVLKIYDISVLCGYRNKEDQDRAFDEDRSKLKFPYSNHNVLPSNAVDIAPYPLDWSDIEEFCFMAGIIFSIAKKLNIKIRFGKDFKSLRDYPHIELV